MSDPPPKNIPPAELSPSDLISEIQEAAQVQVAAAQPLNDRQAYELERLQLENDRLSDELKEARDLHSLRKRYTGRLFGLTVTWLVAVVVFVTLTGWKRFDFSLSDAVLIAFITSTTVSVLGLFILAGKWLFPTNSEDGKE